MMTLETENPAHAGGVAGLQKSDRLGGDNQKREHSPNGGQSQGHWVQARALERQSIDCARQGLTQRGADRFLTLALASTYALAARDTALVGGFQ